MNILITGIAGLIGSRVADWIINNIPETNIIGVDNLSTGFKENIPENIIFYKIDVESSEIREIFNQHSPVYVFHFAAYAAECLSPFIRKYNYKNNLIGTANIINECIRYNVKRLIFTSSIAVYGHGTPPFNEDYIPHPADPYGIAKYACELDIEIAGKQHNLDWCILRPHNVFGVGQNLWDKYRNVLGVWMYQLINNKPLTIFGDGTQKRAFSCIDDLLEPIWNSAILKEAGKNIINIGATKEYSINELSDVLIKIANKGKKQYLETRQEVKQAWCTSDKAKSILGYKEDTPIFDAVKKMWSWAQKQPNREQIEFKDIELKKGLYSYWK